MRTPDLKRIRPGPIRHESLSDEVLEQVRAIYEIVGPYLNMTLIEIGTEHRLADEESLAKMLKAVEGRMS